MCTRLLIALCLACSVPVLGSCTDEAGGVDGPVLGGVGGPRNCNYPAEPHGMSTGDTVAPYEWMGAVLPDGSTTDFSLAEFHCSPKYDEYRSLVLYGAEVRRIPGYINSSTTLQEHLPKMGHLYLPETENLRREPETCQEAATYLNGYMAKMADIRLGDDNTNGSVNDGGGPIPTAWFIRRSDEGVAYQREHGSRLPMADLVEIRTAIGRIPRRSSSTNCSEGDEEASEPNDRPADATEIGAEPTMGASATPRPTTTGSRRRAHGQLRFSSLT